MKDRSVDWKKILTWKPGEKFLAIGFCLLLLAALIPLFRLTIYAVPYYDDYNFGRFARAAMEQEQSKWAVIPGALECSRTQWYAWQGTYSSIFFMTLMPAIWGEQYYFLGPVFILLLLLAGSMVFTHVILRKVFGMEKWISLAIQAVITTAQFMFIYSAQSGFYWYNGGIHYVGMHGFGLLFLAVSICLERAEGRTAKGLLFTASVLLAMITAGSNFVTALQGLLCLATILLVSVVLERRKCGLWLLPATAVYIIGFGLNVAAPGNSVRAQSYIGWGYGPLESIGRSFLEAVKHIPEYTGLVVLTVMLLLVPLIWQAVKSTDYRFRYPGIVLAWSFGLYATGYTPSLYSLGHAGLSRTLNAVKITYFMLLFLNEIYWIGWLRQLLEKKTEQTTGQLTIQKLTIRNGAAAWWFYVLIGVACLVIFRASPNQAGHYSSYGAYYYVHTGEAYNFHQEYLERVKRLSGNARNVHLQAYRFQPWFLCMGDISEDAGNEANRSLAMWYGKDSVTLISED